MEPAFQVDVVAQNFLQLQFAREVARQDYALAANLFGLASLKDAQRLARLSTTDLQSLADSEEPIFVIRCSKTFSALMTQIEARDHQERIELTRLASMLAGNPPPARDLPEAL